MSKLYDSFLLWLEQNDINQNELALLLTLNLTLPLLFLAYSLTLV
jgi:hypothetical protein